MLRFVHARSIGNELAGLPFEFFPADACQADQSDAQQQHGGWLGNTGNSPTNVVDTKTNSSI